MRAWVKAPTTKKIASTRSISMKETYQASAPTCSDHHIGIGVLCLRTKRDTPAQPRLREPGPKLLQLDSQPKYTRMISLGVQQDKVENIFAPIHCLPSLTGCQSSTSGSRWKLANVQHMQLASRH